MKTRVIVLILLAIATIAFGGASELRAKSQQPGQIGATKRCSVRAVSGSNRGNAFHVRGTTATVRYKVTGPAGCKVQVSASAFYAPSLTGKPYNAQKLYGKRQTRVHGPSAVVHHLSVQIPPKSTKKMGCFYQVDLTYGTYNVTPVLAYGHGILPCAKKPRSPGIAVTKLVNGVDYTKVSIKHSFTYQIAVTNTGNTKLRHIQVEDIPAAGIELISASAGSTTTTHWTHTINRLLPGETTEFTITARVPLYKPGTLKNIVCVDAPTIPGNKDACDDAVVEPETADKTVVCDPTTGKLISVSDEDRDHYKAVNHPTCQLLRVCVKATGKLATIRETSYTSKKHSTDTATCGAPVVKELPKTGVSSTLLNMVGAVSLASAAAYYIVSRRQ